jgi:hypothetical protein
MLPTISLITSTAQDESVSLGWVLSQERPGVEVLLMQSPPEGAVDFSHQLRSALAQATGELFIWLEPGVSFLTGDWLEDIHRLWREACADLVGIRGLSELSVHTLGQSHRQEALQLTRVIGGGQRANTAARRTPVIESVLALGPGVIMGRTTQMRHNLEHYGVVFRSDNVISFSLLSQLFAHMRLAVIDGLPVVEEHPPVHWATMDQLRRAVGFLPLNRQALSVWRRNLEALLRVQPELVRWLCDAAVETRWHRIDQRRPDTLRLVRESVDALVTDTAMTVAKGETVWMLGAGAGTTIGKVLTIPGTRLHLVEPDAALLCHLLTRHDWSIDLLEQRLRLHALDTSHPVWQQVTGRQLVAEFQRGMDESAATVSLRHGGSFYLHESPLLELERALQRTWFRTRELKALASTTPASFDVTVVSPRCAIFNELAQSFHDLGYRTRLLVVPDGGQVSRWEQTRQWAASLLQQRSHLTVFRNRSLLESDTWQEPVPLVLPDHDAWVSWWWDVPNVASIIDQQLPAQQRPALGFARDLLDLLPRGSRWLPPAARPSFCCDDPAPERQSMRISFVGQSRWTAIRTHLAILRDLLSPHIPGGRATTEAWQWRRSALELLDILSRDAADAEHAIESLATFSSKQAYFLGYLWRMATTGLFRMAAIELLYAHGQPVDIFGDGEWVESGLVPREHFRGAAPVSELRNIYRDSRINLNLNFMQVSSTLNPKVLDISACNGFVLTDERDEMRVLFPEAAVRPLAFDQLAQLPPLVERALASDTREAAFRAGEWVRQHHSLTHRALWLAEQFGLGLPPRLTR